MMKRKKKPKPKKSQQNKTHHKVINMFFYTFAWVSVLTASHDGIIHCSVNFFKEKKTIPSSQWNFSQKLQ